MLRRKCLKGNFPEMDLGGHWGGNEIFLRGIVGGRIEKGLRLGLKKSVWGDGKKFVIPLKDRDKNVFKF